MLVMNEMYQYQGAENFQKKFFNKTTRQRKMNPWLKF